MRTFKKLMSVVLSVLMACTMLIPAFAATAADVDPSITIINTNDSVSMKGHTYSVYRIFDVEPVPGTKTYDYTVVDAFKGFFQVKGCATDLDAYDYIAAAADDEDALQAIAKEIYAYAEANNIDTIATGTANNENLVMNVGEYGYYLVYDEGTANGNATNAENVVAAVALTNVIQNANVYLKADAPKLDKTITGVADAATNEVGPLDKEAVDAQIGKHIQFELSSSVPNLTGYTDYTYTVTDTMSAGLTNDENVKIMIGDADVTAQCEIVYNGQTFTATIPYNVLKAYDAGTDIAITYSATLNQDAVAYDQANLNTASLEYSNNPNDATSTDETPEETVKVYTFTLDVTKKSNKGDLLQGAEFELRDAEGNLISVTKVGDTYIVDPNGATTTLVSDANGKIYVKGVAAGEYTLTETKAPEGYNKLTEAENINIEVTYDITAPTEIANVRGTEKTVINRTGGLLPSTGGMGTTLFTVVGIAVMLSAAALLIVKRRKSVVA